MAQYDLIVRNGLIVPEQSGDIGIVEGQIVAIEADLAGSTKTEIDAGGRRLMPGAIDPHVHFNEPGRTHWEGWASGSAALVAGGVTTCIEMPLNANPPTINRAAFDAKLAAASASSQVDFALWGGLTPDSLDHMADLAAAGVIGFKAFMSRTGTDDFQRADDGDLYQGMLRAAELGLPVAVHAENDAITAGLAERAEAEGRITMADYLASRPVVAEVEAIGRAIILAEAAGCALHIVHVSTAAGVALVADARLRGVDVTCETCPHYLAFNDADAMRIGPLAKCAPPIRDAATVEALWAVVAEGKVDMLASDHSPSLPEMKVGTNAFANWGGIAGCQHLAPVTWSLGEERGLSVVELQNLLTLGAARRFALKGKDGIAVGNDADLVIWERTAPAPIAGVRNRHPRSAWDGTNVTWRPVTTILRGHVVYGNLEFDGPTGKFLPGPAYQGRD